MSQNLGSFYFDVSVSIGAAQANLQKLAQSAQQSAQQVQQAFSGIRIQPGGSSGAASQSNQSSERAVQAQERAQARIRGMAQQLDAQEQRSATTRIATAERVAEAKIRAEERAYTQAVRLARQIEREEERAAQQARRVFERANPVQGPADPSTAAGRREQAQFQREQTQIVVHHNLDEVDRGFAKLREEARALGNLRLNLSVTANGSREATANIQRMGQALREAKAGETINLDVRAASVEHGRAAVRGLTADIERARQAGARVNVNVQTNAPQQGFLRQGAGGFVQQITPGLATGAAAAAGVVAAQAVVALAGALKEGVQAGIEYNAMLETASVQFKVFTGSAEAAEVSLARLREFADITPFDTEEVIRSGAVFARVTGGNIARMERLVELSGQLATVNPNREQGGGLEGAQIALTEAFSGDFTSAQRRFNISRADIQSIKDAGLVGLELAEALVKAAGGSKQLLEGLGNTFEGRLATATSNLKNLRAEATRPLFNLIGEGLAAFNRDVAQNSAAWKTWAQDIGQAIAGMVSATVTGIKALNDTGNAAADLLSKPQQWGLAIHDETRRELGFAPRVPPPPPPAPAAPAGLTSEQQAQQASLEAAGKEIDAANKHLTTQKTRLEANKKELAAIQLLAKEIEAAYAAQLRPLEEQQRAIAELQLANDARQRDIAQRQVDAGPPVAVRAQAAFDTTILDHEQEVTDIRHRRAELSEQLARAEEAAANRVAEAQIRGAERALQATQTRAQAEAAARQVVMEGLREEARARQEARQAALEGLREEIRGRQEARQGTLEGIREEIRGRQEARQVILDGIREEIRARSEARQTALDGVREGISERRRGYDEERLALDEMNQEWRAAFAERERLADRAHSQAMERYQDQIQALRDQLDVRREQSAAERELIAFNLAENARQRAQTVAGAENAVLRARTGAARRDALERLAEIRAQVAADEKREALQAKIAQEKEAEDRRREAIQDKIAQIERKARDEDRAYQRNKDARQERQRFLEAEQQRADRAAALAEREQRKAEDAQVRALEKADRDQTKIEQAQIRAAEKIDRERTKREQDAIRVAEAWARAEEQWDQAKLRAAEADARQIEKDEQAALRDQEKLDREADRAAQREILNQQQQILTARNALADRQTGTDTVFDAAALDRLREQTALEERRLNIRQRLVDAADPLKLAQSAADKVFADEVDRLLGIRKAVVDGEITIIQNRLKTALAAIQPDITNLQNTIDAQKLVLDALEKRVEAVKKSLDYIKNNPPSAEGLLPAGSTGEELSPAARQDPVLEPPAPPPPGVADIPGVPDITTATSEIGDLFANPALWVEAGQQGLKALWDAFTGASTTSTPPPGTIASIATIATDILQGGMTEGAEQADVGAIAGDAITTGITQEDVGAQASTAISDSFQAAASALGQQLGAVLQSAWTQAVPIADAIPTEIGSHLAAGVEASLVGLDARIGTALEVALNGGWAQAALTADAIPTEIGAHIATGIEAAFVELGTRIGAALEAALNAGWMQAVPVADSISTEIATHITAGEGLATLGVTLGEVLMLALQAAWAASVELVDSIGTEIANHIVAAFSTGFADQQEAITAALAAPFAEDAIGDVVEQAEKVAVDAWAKLAENIEDQERDIVAALEASFIEIDRRFFPEVERKWKAAGADHAKAYVAGFKAERIEDDIARCIQAVLDRIERDEPRFRTAGGAAARMFVEGWCGNLGGLVHCFAVQMQQIEAIADDWGESAGRRFTAGFQQTASAISRGSTTSGGPQVTRNAQGQIVVTAGSPATQGAYAQGTAFVPKDGLAYLHKGEAVIPASLNASLRQAGGVIPPGLAVAAGVEGRADHAVRPAAPTINLHQTINAAPGMDTGALAEVVTTRAVNAIIEVFDHTELNTRPRARRTLPGAT